MQIVTRVELPSESIERVVQCAAVQRRKIARHRSVSHAADRQPDTVLRTNCRTGDYRENTMTAAEFLESVAVATPRFRDNDALDQFIVQTFGRHHASEEASRRRAPAPPS